LLNSVIPIFKPLILFGLFYMLRDVDLFYGVYYDHARPS
jgi:hypothetical protein